MIHLVDLVDSILVFVQTNVSSIGLITTPAISLLPDFAFVTMVNVKVIPIAPNQCDFLVLKQTEMNATFVKISSR